MGANGQGQTGGCNLLNQGSTVCLAMPLHCVSEGTQMLRASGSRIQTLFEGWLPAAAVLPILSLLVCWCLIDSALVYAFMQLIQFFLGI